MSQDSCVQIIRAQSDLFNILFCFVIENINPHI